MPQKVPAVDGLTEADASVTHPEDVAGEVLGCLRRECCQTSVILVMVTMDEIVDEGAGVCL